MRTRFRRAGHVCYRPLADIQLLADALRSPAHFKRYRRKNGPLLGFARMAAAANRLGNTGRMKNAVRLLTIVGVLMLMGCSPGSEYREAAGTAGAAKYYPRQTVDLASAARGKTLVESRCAACHSVGPAGESPVANALPLRHLGTLYPVTDLQEAFAEGITNGHPAMPQITLEGREVVDLIAYLQDVQNHSGP